MYYNNKQKHPLIHILVARAFIGECPEGKEVNHKDSNRGNNIYSNLEYLTRKENIKHAMTLGFRKISGENHPRVKLTNDNVLSIRNEYSRGIINQRELGEKYGVKHNTICQIIGRKIWTHI